MQGADSKYKYGTSHKMSPFLMSIKVPKKITCLSINYDEMMITCIGVNTDNVTLLTTLTFKIMSPKILNSRSVS